MWQKKGHLFGLTRQFVIVSEKEIKTHCKVQRIKWDVLRSLVALQLPTDSGVDEEALCFKDPNVPFRTLKVSTLY